MSNRHAGRLQVRVATWQADQQAISALRRQVFIIEQNVPETLEWDGADDTALHVLAGIDEHPVGTGRLLRSGQIGRMAVAAGYRRQGIGTAILRALIDLAAAENISGLFLNAQKQAVAFYRAHGFVISSPDFDDAGICHCRMDYHPQ